MKQETGNREPQTGTAGAGACGPSTAPRSSFIPGSRLPVTRFQSGFTLIEVIVAFALEDMLADMEASVVMATTTVEALDAVATSARGAPAGVPVARAAEIRERLFGEFSRMPVVDAQRGAVIDEQDSATEEQARVLAGLARSPKRPPLLIGFAAFGHDTQFKGACHRRDRTQDGEGARVIEEARCGFASPAGDIDALTENLLSLARMSDTERKEMGLRGRAYNNANFNRGQLLRQLAGFLLGQDDKPL